MAEEKNKNVLEREYIIPLRYKGRAVPGYKKTPKAVKTVKEFLAKHMKVQDRDLKNVRLDKFLNEALWHRGIKNPIHKIKVKAVKEESGIVRAYALDLPKGIEFKQTREEKKAKEQEKLGKEAAKEIEEKKKEEEKAQEQESTDKDNDGVDDKVEEKEAQKATEEVAKEEAKKEAKEEKHTTSPKSPKETKDLEKTYDKTSRNH